MSMGMGLIVLGGLLVATGAVVGAALGLAALALVQGSRTNANTAHVKRWSEWAYVALGAFAGAAFAAVYALMWVTGD